jgi:hypothetical protein
MQNDLRTEPRQQVSLPVQLEGGIGSVTRDISASGLYFEVDGTQELGQRVNVEIDLDTPGGPMRLKAHGQIMRIESHGARTGVGVKLLSCRLEPVE